MTAARTDADAVELRAGRRPPQKTEVFDWVTLSGVSPHAIALYVVLRMHVNRARDDEEVWTSTLTLAVMMGLSRGDKIKPYLDELIAIEAVEVIREGLHRKNRYIVHSLPPADYRGCMDLKTWYGVHKALLDLKRREEKDKRDARRQAQRDKKPQVNPVTPKRGEQAAGRPVPPKTGEQVPPKTGEPVPPFSGREPRRGFEPAVDEPPTPPTSSPPAPSPVTVEPEKKTSPKKDQPPVVLTADEEALAVELLAVRRDWSPSVLREVLASPQIRERSDRDLVRAAFLRGAREPNTRTPRRLQHDLCPHWAQAARDLTDDGPPAPSVPAQRREWCGQSDCDPTTRQLVDDDMRPRFEAVDGRRVPVWCPRCSRHPAGQSTAVQA